MKEILSYNYRFLLIALLSLFLLSCSDKPSTSAAASGLNAPKTISIVSDSTSSAQLSAAFGDSTTDYAKMPVDTWIKVATGSEMLEEVNYLLCVIGLANTADYPNQSYRAQHNAKNCRRASGGWPLYGEGPVNREMLVTTTRSSSTAPYKQTMWFQVPYGKANANNDWDFVMDMDVTIPPSSSDPLGEFSFEFDSYRTTDSGGSYEDNTNYDGIMKVYSEGGKKYLSFFILAKVGFLTGSDAQWNYDTYQSIIVELDGSGELTGRAKIDGPSSWRGAETSTRKYSTLAFNGSNIHEKSGSDAEVCSSRTSLNSTIWDYKMFYKDTGSAVNMNGGFPLTYTKDGVTGLRGWASRYGLWTDAEGDAPTTVTAANTDQTIFDLVRAGGKLIKMTKGTRDLTSSEKLTYWYSDSDYEVTWNGSAFTIESKTGSAAALSHLNAATTSDSRWPWSRRLNQSVKYMGTSTVVYWAEEDVKPWHEDLNGGNLTLNCYQFCPQGQVSQALAAVEEWNQTAVEAVDSDAFSRTGKSYTFNVTDQLLKYGTTAVILDPTLSNTVESEFRMKLLPSSVTPSNYWNADEEDVHYIWRSGTKEWNQSINYKNQSTSAFYEFSDPVNFDYTHLTANDANDSSTYNNISYVLEYDGGLQGLPSIQLADGSYSREINLKDGDLFAGKAKHANRELVIKAVGIEKNPLATPGQCSALPLTGVSLTPPSSSTVISVSKTWAQQADVTGVAAGYKVIDGVAQ